MSEFKLCYVDNGFVWFTTNSLADQWGDDWNDAPYEYNAGRPYTDKGEFKIYYLLNNWKLSTPEDLYPPNSHYSVEQINNKAIPWLQNDEIRIWAGYTPEQFIELAKEAGCKVYQLVEL